MSNLFADFGLLERATSTQRTLSGGDLIFREGDPAREFFIVAYWIGGHTIRKWHARKALVGGAGSLVKWR